MRRLWVTAINVALGMAASAILVSAIVGSGTHPSSAAAAPILKAAGNPTTAGSPTTVGSATTAGTAGSVPTSPVSSPSSSVGHTGPTIPDTTVPRTTLPTTKATTPPTVAAPPPTYRYPLQTLPYRTVPTTTTTSTTIAGIGNRIPVPPSTLPLSTKVQSAHVSPVFAALSGAGFFVAIIMVAVRVFVSRPNRRR